MLFLLGYLDVGTGEAIYIGDPCYIDDYKTDRPDLMLKYVQNWVEPRAFNDEDKLYQQCVDDYLVHVYIDQHVPDESEWTWGLTKENFDKGYRSKPGNSALILWYDKSELHPSIDMILKKCKIVPIGFVGADSGQIGFFTQTIMDQWVQDKTPGKDPKAPADDYDALGDAIEYSILRAAASPLHSSPTTGRYSRISSGVFASGTWDGDGSFVVCEIFMKEGDTQSVGIMVDFLNRIEDPDDEDSDD